MTAWKHDLKRALPGEAVKALRRGHERFSPRRVAFSLPFRGLERYQYPALLSIELTGRCNLRCFICRRERVPKEDLQFEDLHFLEPAIRRARAVNLTGLGETLLYPKFDKVVEYVSSRCRPGRVLRIITNGTRLSASIGGLLRGRLQMLTVSLNAATAATYSRDMVPADFDRTLAAMRSFLSALNPEDRKRIRLHFVAHARSFTEIPDFVALARELGVSIVSVGNFLADDAERQPYTLLHVAEAYSNVLDKAEAMARTWGMVLDARRFRSEVRRSPDECLSPFYEIYLDVRGEVTPCCFAGGHSMGNVFRDGFKSVWFGAPYRKLRAKRHLQSCGDCARLLPLEEFGAHFTGSFKKTPEYAEAKRKFLADSRI